MPSLTKLTVTNNPVTEFSGLENTNALKEINLKLTNIEDFKEEDLPEL